MVVGAERLRFVVGLGNPGAEYAATRHNLGFRLVELAARAWGLPRFTQLGPALVAEGMRRGVRLLLIKPQLYMNRSGLALQDLAPHLDFSPEQLLVCYDDLDLPLGRLRLRQGGGAGGHKGLESVIAALGTEVVPRLRMGIAPEEAVEDATAFVLSPFKAEEEEVVESLLSQAVEAVEVACIGGLDAAMNRFNAPDGE